MFLETPGLFFHIHSPCYCLKIYGDSTWPLPLIHNHTFMIISEMSFCGWFVQIRTQIDIWLLDLLNFLFRAAQHPSSSPHFWLSVETASIVPRVPSFLFALGGPPGPGSPSREVTWRGDWAGSNCSGRNLYGAGAARFSLPVSHQEAAVSDSLPLSDAQTIHLLADRARKSIFLTLDHFTPVFNLSFLLNATQIHKIDTQVQRAGGGLPSDCNCWELVANCTWNPRHLWFSSSVLKDFYFFTHYTVYFLLHLNLFSYTENLGSEPYLLIAYLYYSGCKIFQVVPILLLTEYCVELKIFLTALSLNILLKMCSQSTVFWSTMLEMSLFPSVWLDHQFKCR